MARPPGRRFAGNGPGGLAHANNGNAMGADRYLVHLVKRADTTELIDGTPIDTAIAARIACVTCTVQHVVSDQGEPLQLGRRSREWNTAQRRAILVRDGGRCRFPGCEWTFVDIHRLHPWDHGGPTDISNGMAACGRHHTLVHHGFTATGDANHTVTFRRPDGTIIGTTTPPAPLIRPIRSLHQQLRRCPIVVNWS